MKLATFGSFVLAVAAMTLVGSAAAADNASNYPDRPVRMLVPNAAGASVEVLETPVRE